MVTLDADETTFDFVPVADVDCETSHGVVLAVFPGCMVQVPVCEARTACVLMWLGSVKNSAITVEVPLVHAVSCTRNALKLHGPAHMPVVDAVEAMLVEEETRERFTLSTVVKPSFDPWKVNVPPTVARDILTDKRRIVGAC